MVRTASPSRSFWLTIIALTFLANLAAVRSSYLRWNELGVDLFRSVWGILAAVYLILLIACAWLFISVLLSGSLPFVTSRFKLFEPRDRKAILLGWMLFLAILVLIPFIKFTLRIGRDENPLGVDAALLFILYFWMCWYALLVAMAALKVALQTTWQVGFVSALVLLGLVYEIMLRLNAITAYPLSMGWSEGSRYYYASLYFSRWIYGEPVALPTLHPSRYLLQSIPFLIPGLSITVHRFWQFFLWIGLTGGATIALAKRAFAPQEKAAQWLFAGWAFLFFMRLGIYYHLEVMVILPLLFVRRMRPWQSLVAVILASVWAGISRVNWFPVPAMIATAIYLLETPLHSQPGNDSAPVSFRQITGYLARPALWLAVGLISALAAQAAYIFLSGNAGNADVFASSFFSDLLWYRLWPNANHFLGILPAILIFSSPLILILVMAARQWRALHSLRWIGLVLMIGLLFVGSLVVSVKIGGGGDLHNMDAYAILITVIAAYFVGGRVAVEPGEPAVRVRSWPTFTFAALIPILFLILLLAPYPTYNWERNEKAYGQLIGAVNELKESGPVLFINERQLVTFGDVDVPLVADYEAVTLMEMAMSNNQGYLNRFYADLKSHRFAAIVAVKQNVSIKESGSLAEENNAWNSRVSPYILCYYQPMLTVEPQGNRIEVYVPAPETAQCP